MKKFLAILAVALFPFLHGFAFSETRDFPSSAQNRSLREVKSDSQGMDHNANTRNTPPLLLNRDICRFGETFFLRHRKYLDPDAVAATLNGLSEAGELPGLFAVSQPDTRCVFASAPSPDILARAKSVVEKLDEAPNIKPYADSRVTAVLFSQHCTIPRMMWHLRNFIKRNGLSVQMSAKAGCILLHAYPTEIDEVSAAFQELENQVKKQNFSPHTGNITVRHLHVNKMSGLIVQRIIKPTGALTGEVAFMQVRNEEEISVDANRDVLAQITALVEELDISFDLDAKTLTRYDTKALLEAVEKNFDITYVRHLNRDARATASAINRSFGPTQGLVAFPVDDSIVLRGDASLIEKLSRFLDIDLVENEHDFHIAQDFRLQYGDPERIVMQLNEIARMDKSFSGLSATEKSREGHVTVISERHTMDRAAEIIQSLDREEALYVRIFRLKHVASREMATLLRWRALEDESLRDILVVSEPNRSQILVVAGHDLIAQTAQAIGELDEPTSSRSNMGSTTVIVTETATVNMKSPQEKHPQSKSIYPHFRETTLRELGALMSALLEEEFALPPETDGKIRFDAPPNLAPQEWRTLMRGILELNGIKETPVNSSQSAP